MGERIETTPPSRLQLFLSDAIRVARGRLGLNDNDAPPVVRPRTYCERFFDNCHRGSVPVGRLTVINSPKED